MTATSRASSATTNSLGVITVPAFKDNYVWIVHDGFHAAVIDPGDAAPVIAALEAHSLRLTAILLTHHHADHVGGVPALCERYRVPVYGPRNERIAGITQALSEGDRVALAKPAIELSVLDVPGHTAGHIAYVATAQHWLFCGDTLFAGGCGRLFEGTPAQMHDSLGKLAALPEDTLIYCAHEYTLSNLRFAREAEPGNAIIEQRLVHEQQRRDDGYPTVPSTVAIEKETNPFLRTGEKKIIGRLQALGRLKLEDPVSVLAALREWKNVF